MTYDPRDSIPTLDYGQASVRLPPARAGDYVLATVGGLLVTSGAFGLLVGVATVGLRRPLGSLGVPIWTGLALLSLIAGASSFYSTLSGRRQRRAGRRRRG